MAFLQSGGALVTSPNIVNGAVVNEDINDAAAIALTKLAGSDASGYNDSILDPTTIQGVVVPISSADIFGMGVNTGPTIIAAPGAGKVIIVLGWQFVLDYGGTAYVGAQNCTLYYSGLSLETGTGQLTSTQMTATADLYYSLHRSAAVTATTAVNRAIVFGLAGGTAYTTGNSTAKISVQYVVQSI